MIAPLLIAAFALAVLLALVPRAARRWRDATGLRAMSVGARRAWLVAFLVAILYGAEKTASPPPPAGRVGRLLTVLRSGSLAGPTNAVASSAQSQALAVFAAESSNMVAAAEQVIIDAQEQLRWLEAAVTNIAVAYLASDITRDIPAASNLSARIESTQLINAGARLRVFVNFSAEPLSAPMLGFQFGAGPAAWQTAEVVTNSFPATFTVLTRDGPAECYAIDIDVPQHLRGRVLRPVADLPLGGPDPGQYFMVQGEGILVEDAEEIIHIGATGWHQIPHMPSWEVRTRGGVIVEAKQTL